MGCAFKRNQKHKINKALLKDLEGPHKSEPRASPSRVSWEIFHYTFPLPGPLSLNSSDGASLNNQVSIQVFLPSEKNSPEFPSITLFSLCPLSCKDMIFTIISSTCLLSIFTTRISTNERLCLVQPYKETGTMFAM